MGKELSSPRPAKEGNKYLDVDNCVGTRVLLNGLENTDTSKIVSAGDHDEVTNTKLDAILNLLSLKIELNGVVFFNIGVRVADRATIVGSKEWDSLRTQLDAADPAEFILGLVGSNLVQGELALDVEQETEVLVGAVNGDNVCMR